MRGFNGRCLRGTDYSRGFNDRAPRLSSVGIVWPLLGESWDDNLSNKRGREEWGKDMPVVECRERRIIHVQSVEKNLIRGTDFIEGIG